ARPGGGPSSLARCRHRGRGLMRDLPEEVTFFARSAAFALVIATIYWFVSYEPAGTTLLAFFGVASSLAAIVLFRAWRRSVGGGRIPPLQLRDHSITSPAVTQRQFCAGALGSAQLSPSSRSASRRAISRAFVAP